MKEEYFSLSFRSISFRLFLLFVNKFMLWAILIFVYWSIDFSVVFLLFIASSSTSVNNFGGLEFYSTLYIDRATCSVDNGPGSYRMFCNGQQMLEKVLCYMPSLDGVSNIIETINGTITYSETDFTAVHGR